MDLLGSIMSSMDKPPSTATDEEKKRNKERKRQMENWKQQENKRILAFRTKVKSRIENFVKDATAKKLEFEPMEDVDRALVREISDNAGLTSFSFGQDEVDRHVIIWKREVAPSDDEVAALRRGEEWNEEKAELAKQKRMEMEANRNRKLSHTAGPAPKSDYHMKYNHLISLEVGKTGAQDIAVNKQYGNVKLENKRDRRTIEETLAERRAKKMKQSEDISTTNEELISQSTMAAAANNTDPAT